MKNDVSMKIIIDYGLTHTKTQTVSGNYQVGTPSACGGDQGIGSIVKSKSLYALMIPEQQDIHSLV